MEGYRLELERLRTKEGGIKETIEELRENLKDKGDLLVDEKERNAWKIKLFDEIEKLGDCGKDIVDIERMVGALKLDATQPTNAGVEQLRDSKNVIDQFCPYSGTSSKNLGITDCSDTCIGSNVGATTAGIEKSSAYKGPAMQGQDNQVDVRKLEESVEYLLEELKNKSHAAIHQRQDVSPSYMKIRGVKPHKYRSGDDICMFLERFEQYVTVNNIRESNLDMLLLALVDEDKMYRRLKGLRLSVDQRSNVKRLIEAVKEALYPMTEARIMRSKLSRVSQKEDETVEDFAHRIENLAEKAYADLQLRGEASLSRLLEGSKSVAVRRKLMESDVETFENARRIAIKEERIEEAILTKKESPSLIDLDIPIFTVGETDHITQPKEAKVKFNVCTSCDKVGHEARDCWKEVICQLCNVKGHVASICRTKGPKLGKECTGCNGWGHEYKDCPTVRKYNGPINNRGSTQNSEFKNGGYFQEHQPASRASFRGGPSRTSTSPRRSTPQTFQQRSAQRDYLNSFATGEDPDRFSRRGGH